MKDLKEKPEVNLIEDAYKQGLYVGLRVGEKALWKFFDRHGRYFPGRLGEDLVDIYRKMKLGAETEESG